VALKAVLTEQITKLTEAGVTDFLSGMAEGTDVFCAEIVLALQENNPVLKLHCVLPCKEQADRWSVSARERYRTILDQADSIVCVNRHYSQRCMLERNEFLVDHAEILLAVYNGECRGGTAATVRYAQKQGKRVLIIDPNTLPCAYEG